MKTLIRCKSVPRLKTMVDRFSSAHPPKLPPLRGLSDLADVTGLAAFIGLAKHGLNRCVNALTRHYGRRFSMAIPTGFISILVNLFPVPSALARQNVAVGEAEVGFARLSVKDITLIRFERAPVRKITGNAGDFIVEKDEERGAVFIRPTQSASIKPFTLFVSTDKSTVALLLQPVDAPGDTIVIKDPATWQPTSAVGMTPEDRVGPIKTRLLQMTGLLKSDELQVRSQRQTVALRAGIQFTLVRTDQGQGLMGEVYQLKNVTNETLRLQASTFNKPGVLAVGLRSVELKARESTDIYLISEARNDE